jgi:serine/threonine protein kinase
MNNSYSFNPSNFKMVSILGSGSFGTVLLAEYETQYYAIKRLPKNRINNNEIDQIMLEKQLLMEMDENPFILHLFGTCQTDNSLYFVTEILEHGDLFNAIYSNERLKHKECVFYGACIIMGLDFIHSKNIVYRDLKPENIMIGSNGYPKIIDFGMAKKLPYTKLVDGEQRNFTKCNTLCGTPEYVAPELILGKAYDYSIDIWALGVILYEMISRYTPFDDQKKSPDRITNLFTNIVMCGKNGIDISNKLDKRTDGTSNARKLISQLLNGDTLSRLGPNNKPSSLLNHPYFLSTSITAEELYNQTFEPPIIQPEYIGRELETDKHIDNYTGDQDIFKDF